MSTKIIIWLFISVFWVVVWSEDVTEAGIISDQFLIVAFGPLLRSHALSDGIRQSGEFVTGWRLDPAKPYWRSMDTVDVNSIQEQQRN